MPIYTKSGDAGETSYISGRTSKDSSLINAIGNIDELNAILGIVSKIAEEDVELQKQIEKVQAILFTIGSSLADTKVELELNSNRDKNLHQQTEELEKEIDVWTKQLPTLKNFILPGGSALGAHLHHARAVCRRNERNLVAYLNTTEIEKYSKKYQQNVNAARKFINRLSDWLFTAARYANYSHNTPEKVWNSKHQ